MEKQEKNWVTEETTDRNVHNTDSKTDRKLRSQRFSKEELRDIRNRIPIRCLIEEELRIPSRMDGSIFRFQCPLCRSFHTAVKKETNLARCFDCSKNFNTIDITKEVKGVEFLESAAFLRGILAKLESGSDNKHIRDKITQPVQVGTVLKRTDLIRKAMRKSDKTDCSQRCEKMEERLKSLEKSFRSLSYNFDLLREFAVKEVTRR